MTIITRIKTDVKPGRRQRKAIRAAKGYRIVTARFAHEWPFENKGGECYGTFTPISCDESKQYFDVVCSGRPTTAADQRRFLEIDYSQGNRASVGNWFEQIDGSWILQLPDGRGIHFDGPPSRDGGRYTDSYNATGHSANLGEWIYLGSDTWALRIQNCEVTL